jgi:hypothetical protein
MKFSVIAGLLSTGLFALGNIPMVVKAVKTQDLRSYSRKQILLNNAGNVIHWIYVASLPIGPIWLLHGFHTIVTMLMLFWHFRYEDGSSSGTHIEGKHYADVSTAQ